MVGYLEILIWMLCVYFVFKGVEIYQMDRTSSRPDRGISKIIGVGALLASMVVAVGFFIFTAWYSAEFSRRNDLNREAPFPINGRR